MKVNSEVFRAYDIRGIVDEELTPKLVENIGKAIGSEVLEEKLKISMWEEMAGFQEKKLAAI